VRLRAYTYDLYTQIGIVTLIGLAAKNAILIVEFAKLRREEGLSIVGAADEAARIRLRPILMTSIAFILGVLPLVIASGAGAGARRSLGTAVFTGMIAATALATFIVPVLYGVVQRIAEGRSGQKAEPEPAGSRAPTVGRASTVTPTSDSAVSDLPQDHPIPDSATAPAYRKMANV
jgi:predicted RND superfamily exporter protein